jgi:hypothetical protein
VICSGGSPFDSITSTRTPEIRTAPASTAATGATELEGAAGTRAGEDGGLALPQANRSTKGITGARSMRPG